MKNFNAFSKALIEQFQIPPEIFNLNNPALVPSGIEGEYFVSDSQELPSHGHFEYFQYIKRFDEGWECVRLYIDRMHISDIINFILKYHQALFSEDELQPVKIILQSGKGHFAMLDHGESHNYIEGVFDQEQAFIEVAKLIDD